MAKMITVKGINKINRALDKFNTKTQAEFRKALKMAMTKIISESIKRCPVDRGPLHIDTYISDQVIGLGKIIAEGGYYPDYAEWVHEGTRPHWVPLNVFYDWAGRIGYTGELQYKIAKSAQNTVKTLGTKPNPYLAEAVNVVAPEVVRDIKAAIKRGTGL